MDNIDEALEALRRLVDGDIPSSSALDRYERTIRQALERQRVPDHLERLSGMTYERIREALKTLGHPDYCLNEDQREALGVAITLVKRQIYAAAPDPGDE